MVGRGGLFCGEVWMNMGFREGSLFGAADEVGRWQLEGNGI